MGMRMPKLPTVKKPKSFTDEILSYVGAGPKAADVPP